MKVYIVTALIDHAGDRSRDESDWESLEVRRVCSTREAAEELAQLYADRSEEDADYEVTEWEVE